MNYRLKYLCYVLPLLLLAACSKMDETYSEFLQGGEKVYSVKPKIVQFYPGDNRIKVKVAMISAIEVKKVRISWNGGNESTEWDVEPNLNSDTTIVEGIIDPITEGRHTFELTTFDVAGNQSIKLDTAGVVYGELYASTLKNRGLKSAFFKDNSIEIKWLEIPYENAVGGEVFYKDKDGNTIRVYVPLDEFETHIDARPVDDSVYFRTIYKPESNAIDTFYAELQSVLLTAPTPELLDKSLFEVLNLPGDAQNYPASYVNLENIWDNDLTANSWYGTADSSGNPHWYTFDLGVVAKLTEFTIWQRGIISELSLVYAHANMKNWEIWGSNEPDSDGGWENWSKLVECESFKPSGLPFGEVTDEDYEYAAMGDTFTFPSDIPPVRYIRIKVFETWDQGRKHRSFLQEISFKGIEE